MIALEAVRKVYPGGVVALDDVSLRVEVSGPGLTAGLTVGVAG
ncbi:hypothetical protein ACQP1P_45195 [Dactylosporangium sp. CA-052675]